MKKRIVIIILALIAVLSIATSSVWAAGGGYLPGFHKVKMNDVTITEPISVVDSFLGYAPPGTTCYPGETLASGYVVLKNTGPIIYGIRIYVNFDSPAQPIPWLRTIATVKGKATETVYEGGIVNIAPNETLRIEIEVKIDYSSPPGSIANPVLIFERTTPQTSSSLG